MRVRLSFACLTVALASLSARSNPEDGTRVAAALRQPSRESFASAFASLSEDEQSEIIRILTTEMRAWPVLERIPATSHAFPEASDKQKNSALGLYNWLKAGPSKDPLDHLRYVGLSDRPHVVKLSFERGFCKMREAVNDQQSGLAWRTWVVSITKLWEAERAPASNALAPEACNEQIQIVVSADGGNGVDPLKEKPVLTMDIKNFPRYFDSRGGWEDLRRRVWESVEMLQADLRGEMAALPARLRVIEVAGVLGQNEFLERRAAAILHRARAQASLEEAAASPGSR